MSPLGYTLEFLPSMLGNYTVTIAVDLAPTYTSDMAYTPITHAIEVIPPVEDAPVIQAPATELKV